MVPYAKARLSADEAQLGVLLLCVGIGSLIAMPVTGVIVARRGSRTTIILGGCGLGLIFPLLAIADNPVGLGAALLLFGAFLGTLDVAMNAHAVEVEAAAGEPLMSGFHALFSIGGILGAGGVTLMLSAGLAPPAAGVAVAIVTLVVIALAAPGLLRTAAHATERFVMPRGVVALLAVLAATLFLVEGAVLDWGALLIADLRLLGMEQAGVGYLLFSIAMASGRLLGDRIVAHLGPTRLLQASSALAIAGFGMLLLLPLPGLALAGFAFIGFGAANIVPILFSAAGRQRAMPPALAVAAVTTIGYAGVLVGPAAVGVIAHAIGLDRTFWVLALLMAAPLVAARAVTALGR